MNTMLILRHDSCLRVVQKTRPAIHVVVVACINGAPILPRSALAVSCLLVSLRQNRTMKCTLIGPTLPSLFAPSRRHLFLLTLSLSLFPSLCALVPPPPCTHSRLYLYDRVCRIAYIAENWYDIHIRQVKIVDPDTFREKPTGEPGELWVSSPSVAAGYWGKPELSRETFQARILHTDEEGWVTSRKDNERVHTYIHETRDIITRDETREAGRGRTRERQCIIRQ